MQIINWKEILENERLQLLEEGRDISSLQAELATHDIDDLEAEQRVRKLYARVESLPRRQDFTYEEPSEWDKIERASKRTCDSPVPFPPDQGILYDKVYGAWLGRSAGCLLGKPVEGWPRNKIEELLNTHNAYPLDEYFTIRHMPRDVETWMMDEYVQNAIEYCKAMPRDDDMDYTILALKTLETYGREFTAHDVGTMWLTYLPPFMTYTAERAAYTNLCAGIEIPQVAFRFNPYREWIGAQIRTDLYGYVNPGDPGQAAEMAYRDASLSHMGNGIYGAMFVAAMNAAAFGERQLASIIVRGLSHIPEKSRLHEAISWVLELHNSESDWRTAGDKLLHKFASYHRVHTINNAAIVVFALLYGEQDLGKTITIAVMMGLDTDCNAATAGSIVGIINGARALPVKWVKPLHDQIESYIAGEGSPHISQLALRTLACMNRS